MTEPTELEDALAPLIAAMVEDAPATLSADDARAVLGYLKSARTMWERQEQTTGSMRRTVDVTLRRMQGARMSLGRLDGLGPKQLGEDDATGRYVHECLVDALAYLGAVGEAPNNLDALVALVETWQRETFPTATLAGASAHLVQEAGEVRKAALFEGIDNRDDVGEEIADAFFLVVQCATLAGVSLGDVVARKLAKNRARAWPTEPDDDGVFNHVEETDDDEPT